MMQSLNIQTLPLNGRHIIEASAGTGKTYNITELYLRLILQKQLMPKQILVMTFTKDATQEIISRVEAKIRDAIDPKEPEKAVVYNEEQLNLLKQALAEIDEASIFTIHGFCKKVLSEYAIDSGIEMDIAMEVDSSDLLRKCVEAYFRKNINHDPDNLAMLTSFGLETPEKCLGRGGIAEIVKTQHPITAMTGEEAIETHISDKRSVLEHLERNKDVIFDALVTAKDKKKASITKEAERLDEWGVITDWLSDNQLSPRPNEVSKFVNGNRYRKREDIREIFEGLIRLKGTDFLKNDSTIAEYIRSLDSAQFIQSMCEQLRRDFIHAKQAKGILDFDDLIRSVSSAVSRSQELVQQLQAQYPVALIDEFQDTDVQQYTILNTLYPKENNNLLFVMIGDPKQAIYGFRGGDIYTYLKAKQSSQYQWNMDTNWRSSEAMIRAYNRLFVQKDYDNDDVLTENVFGQGIDYQVVKSSPQAHKKVKNFGDDLPPINYFYYNSEDNNVPVLRRGLAQWCANEVVKLLKAGKVEEKDIAILVNNRTQANLIERAFNDCHLSTVYLSQRERVYDANEATELLYVMEGIANYSDKGLLKRALSTSLMGGSALQLRRYTHDDALEEWDQAIQTAKEYKYHWEKHGFISLVIKLIHEKLVLRDKHKERSLTNMLHLAELIRTASNRYKQIPQLIKWYRQQLNQSAQGEGELRLESDDNLIKIVTIHSSKGLEYPVVFIPFACDAKQYQNDKIKKFYDGDNTVYSLGSDESKSEIVKQQAIEETVRLLYVAVTRAESRCYIGMAPFKDIAKSPLYHLLDCDSEDDLVNKVDAIVGKNNNHSHLVIFDSVEPNTYSKTTTTAPQSLQAQTPLAPLEDGWKMMSFSSLSRRKFISYDFERPLEESEDETIKTSTAQAFRFAVKKGATIGNVLHNVLEKSDFASGRINDDVLRQQLAIYPVQDDAGDNAYQPIKQWLESCLHAPIPMLDNPQGTFSLKHLPLAQTLREAEFHFPVGNEHAYSDQISRILAEYRGQDRLSNPLDTGKVYGMLKGFIDLIFEYQGRYYIADYKSNHLGDRYEDYDHAKMQAKNQDSLYDLQYLIYCVAVDRYLQQRLDDYSYERYFGGVYYLYLRGMKDGYGVYATKPPYHIIQKLSQYFAGSGH